jgi:hypothetical protein
MSSGGLPQVSAKDGCILIIGHAMGIFLSKVPIFPEPHLIVIGYAKLVPGLFREHDIVKADAVPLGINVEFADRICLVSGVSERLRQGLDVRHRQPVGVDPIAMCARKGSRHKRAAGRNANGASAMALGKSGACPGQLVECGRHQHGMAGAPHHRGGPMVRGYQ